MNEKISVIVPVYNGEKFIEKCINSILNQSYKNFEIIIINDGSTDSTEDILKKDYYNNSKVKIITKKNTGVSNSRNIGIKESTGEYIVFVDADDWIEKNTLEVLYSKYIENPNHIIRGCYELNYADGSSRKYKEKYIIDYLNNELDKSEMEYLLSGEMNGYTPLLFIPKKYLEKTFFDEELAFMEDFNFYLDLLLNGVRIIQIPNITYHYFYNNNSASRSNEKLLRNINNSLLLYDKVVAKLKENNKFSQNNIRAYNTSIIRGISENLFLLYKYSKKEITEELIKNKKIKNISQDINYNSINYQNKIIIKALQTQKKNLVIFALFIRKILSRIKGMIKR